MKPRRNIVTVRLNDDERALLECMRLEKSKSVSDLLREVIQPTLQQFMNNRRGVRRLVTIAAKR